MLTIQFDRRFFSRTIKIHDVILKTVLPSEFSATKFFTFQVLP